MALSDREIPDAPYVYVWEEGIVEGVRVKVYMLGKYGKEKIDATARDIAAIKRELKQISEKIDFLLDVIGKDALKDFCKSWLLKKFEDGKARRRWDVIDNVFPDLKLLALHELIVDGVLDESERGGWIKLRKPEKGGILR